MRSATIRRPRGRRSLTSAAALAAAASLLLTGCGTGAGAHAEEPAPSGSPSGSEGEGSPSPSSPPAPASPSESPEETEPAEELLLAYGADSEQVRELQARLRALDHFAAQPTGFYGDVTVGAVSSFQEAAGLEVSGAVFASTWHTLTGMTESPSHEEMYPPELVVGYGANSEQVRELQARLKQLGHFDVNPTGYYGDVTTSSVRAYQEAAGLKETGTVYQPTWDALTAGTDEPSREEMYPPVDIPEPEPEQNLDERCLTGHVLCISKTSRTLSWVIDGEVEATMDVRFGAAETPTREGVFSVYWKSRHHHSTLYDSPMPYAMFFDGGQAVHFSSDFAANGYSGASHGCVNVRDEGAIAGLYADVREGDKVVVYW